MQPCTLLQRQHLDETRGIAMIPMKFRQTSQPASHVAIQPPVQQAGYFTKTRRPARIVCETCYKIGFAALQARCEQPQKHPRPPNQAVQW
jgi:hypothetical protein